MDKKGIMKAIQPEYRNWMHPLSVITTGIFLCLRCHIPDHKRLLRDVEKKCHKGWSLVSKNKSAIRDHLQFLKGCFHPPCGAKLHQIRRLGVNIIAVYRSKASGTKIINEIINYVEHVLREGLSFAGSLARLEMRQCLSYCAVFLLDRFGVLLWALAGISEVIVS